MSHLDEGLLHAYLDGEAGAAEVDAHLAACSECRARLEEARRLRDAGVAILKAAGPPRISTPPFEEVLARAGRRKPRTVQPAIALAWAASLALALTVGWYARSLMLTRTGAEVAGEAGAAVAKDQVPATPVEAGPPAARPVDQLAQRAPAREATTQPTAGAAAGAMQDRAVANLATAEAKANVDTEPVVEAARRAAEAQAPAMRAAAAPAPAPAAPTLATGEPETGAAVAAWITVTPAEAERRLGGPLATIPGLPSLGTAVFGSGAATVARTIQVLGPGQTIELVQQRRSTPPRERAAAPAAAAPQPGRAVRDEPDRSVTVEWERFSVTGRALVPADSLRVLLAKLRRY